MEQLSSEIKRIYVGIDDGHDGIKIVFNDEDGNLHMHRMPSVARATINGSELTEISKERLLRSLITVENTETASETFLVDKELVSQKDNTRTNDYPYNPLNIALIYKAMREAGVEVGDNVRLAVISGLPANRYFDKVAKQKNQELVDKKKNSLSHIERVYSHDDEKRYHIDLVDIAPEGYGVGLDLMLQDSTLEPTEYLDDVKEYGCIIIDIGGRTVDVIKIMAVSLLPNASEFQSFDKGILFLKDKIATLINERLGGSFEINDNIVDRAIRTGWVGRANSPSSTDVTDIIEDAFNSHVNSIYQDIKAIFSSPEALGGIVLAGGGSILLGQKLQERIKAGEHNVETILIDAPEMANAKGFWKLAVNKFLG